MIDFPASPVDLQIFNAPSGISYIWKDAIGAWVSLAVTGTPPTGPAGGDLVGTYPNPLIKPGANGEMLKTVGTAAAWAPAIAAPTGPAGGDLQGTYPNPTLKPGTALTVVSDTAPASPVDNMLWFKSDTGILYVRYNDGTSAQWVPATPPLTPPVPQFIGFSKGWSVNGGAVPASDTDIPWDTTEFDNTGAFVTNAYTFTCPANRAGVWRFNATVYMSGGSAAWNYAYMNASVNNTNVKSAIYSGYSGVLYTSGTLLFSRRLNAGDVLKIRYNSPNSMVVYGQSGFYAWYEGQWMGA